MYSLQVITTKCYILSSLAHFSHFWYFVANLLILNFHVIFSSLKNNLEVLWPNRFRVKIDIERAQMFWSFQGILVKQEIFREICAWIDKIIILFIKTDWKTQL